jgi:hypothetical protein
VTGWIRAIADAPVYLALMGFLGLYPVVTGLYWIVGAVIFSVHRERSDLGFYELDEHPHVSVLVAAHNEESVIVETVGVCSSWIGPRSTSPSSTTARPIAPPSC